MDFNFSPGDRLEVVIGGHHCVSDVQEITRKGRLIISAPMFRTMLVPLSEGELFQISYYRMGGMFSFMAQVVRRYQEDGLYLTEVDIRSPISKYQRREFVRMDTSAPLSVRLLALPESIAGRTVDETLKLLYDRSYVGVPRPLLEGEEVYRCYAIDLSGGGVCFTCREKFKRGALLECTFHLDLIGGVTADAQVVRTGEEYVGAAGWKVSAQFVNIEERIRRKFIKYIFARQSLEGERGGLVVSG